MDHKHGLIFTAILFLFCSANAQRPYWQQRVEYVMDIDVNAKKHQYEGKQTLTYYNNSPDTLDQVFYHLYFNAFQPNSAMDMRSRTISDSWSSRITQDIINLKKNQQGYHKIEQLTQDGKSCTYTYSGTILEVKLAYPVPPGGKTVLYTEWDCQVPLLLERAGWNSFEGVDYNMAQWYPKMCEYDEEGWHADPYIGREFYGVFGDFDVTIHLDKKYLVGGTGYLMNPQEVGKGYEDTTQALDLPSGSKLSWHFFAPDVHDFMWAADKDYVHDKVQANDSLVMHFLYLSTARKSNWKQLQPEMVKMFAEMGKRYGVYPYKQFSFIQGGDGGMEYPMATLITEDGSFYDLLSVSVHEAIHNWYYGALGNNESKYPFMDEGFTTWASYQMEDYLLGTGLENPAAEGYEFYSYLVSSPDFEPLSTHSDFYNTANGYELSAYYSGVVFVDQLIGIIGKENFNTGMKRYFNEWKFKHPRPADFIHVMEKVSGLELDWYLEQYTGTLNKIDYGVKKVIGLDNNTTVIIERKGDFVMPVDIIVEKKNGTKVAYTIPLDVMRGGKISACSPGNDFIILPDWQWVNTSYQTTIDIPLAEIKNISINTLHMADQNSSNDKYR